MTPTIAKVTPTEAPKSAENPLQGLNICSPTEPKPASTAPSNIFGSATQTFGTPKTETSSIFGNSSFGSAFGGTTKPETSQPSIFGTPTSTVSTQQSVFGSASPAVSTQASIFGQTTTSTASSHSVFGTGDPKTAVSPNQVSSPFSLVKPDQSVFGGSAAPLSPPTSPFASATSTFGNTASSGIFGGAASNVFGSPQAAKTPVAGGGLFATAAQAQPAFGQSTGLFSQSNFTSPTTAASSVFGGNASFGSPSTNIFAQAAQNPQAPSSGLFGSQNSFGQSATSGGSVFGGSSTAAASPFGSASVFGGGNSSGAFSSGFGSSVTQSGFASPTGGSSIFNQQQQQPAFGGGAVFGNKPSIFGQATSPQSTGQTNSMFEQLGSQQSGNLFGGLSQQPPQQQQQQQSGGFSGSAFSSWR